jgi:antitoxin (DNA-binding transcriptional repressor) of toxin-antitoxin stability system
MALPPEAAHLISLRGEAEMVKATIQEAETHLAELVDKAQGGEEVLLYKGEKPVARIVSLPEEPAERKLGIMKGVFEVGPEFFEPLPEDELEAWGL